MVFKQNTLFSNDFISTWRHDFWNYNTAETNTIPNKFPFRGGYIKNLQRNACLDTRKEKYALMVSN